MTLPRLRTFMEVWEQQPPTAELLGILARGFGWKPREPKAQRTSLRQFAAEVGQLPGVVIR